MIPHPKLLRLAEKEVERASRLLPPDVAAAARDCVVLYQAVACAEETAGDDEEEALLGLFEGFSRMDPLPGDPHDMPRITLFLETLWQMADQDEKEFRSEVRLTYLHELGHYLGWGEEQIVALGLG